MKSGADNLDCGGVLRKMLAGAAARSRDGKYSIDDRIHPLSALPIACRKLSAAMRGLLAEQLLASCGRPLFLGRNVRIQHPRHVHSSSGSSIGDHTLIHGLSAQGINIGDGVTINRFVTLRSTGALRELGVGARIGNRSSLGAFTYVGAVGECTSATMSW